MQIGTLDSYKSVTVAKLKILVYLAPHRKKSKSYFENRGKAHDRVVIAGKYSKFLNSRRVNSAVHIYVGTEIYIYIYI